MLHALLLQALRDDDLFRDRRPPFAYLERSATLIRETVGMSLRGSNNDNIGDLQVCLDGNGPRFLSTTEAGTVLLHGH